MNKNRVKGKAKEIEGRVVRGAGKLTGSRRTQAKGALRQAEGKVQGAIGRLEEAADDRAGRRKTVRVETTRTTTVRKRRG